MRTVIYLDSLLLINFLIGWFLLRAAGLLTGTEPPWRRGLAGAVLAALSTLILLAPMLPLPLQAVYQLGTAVCVVGAAFPWRGLRCLLREVFWYFGLNLGLAGLVMLAVTQGGAAGMHTNNLAVYFDVSPLLLLGCTLVVYGAARLCAFAFGRPAPEPLWSMELELGGVTLRVAALRDTGFSVRDAFTGRPVVLVSLPAVAGRLPPALEEYLCGWFGGDSGVVPPAELGVRLLHCGTAVGGGLLPGVPVKRLRLTCGGQTLCTGGAVAAFCGQRLADGRYDALFGPDLTGREEKTTR